MSWSWFSFVRAAVPVGAAVALVLVSCGRPSPTPSPSSDATVSSESAAVAFQPPVRDPSAGHDFVGSDSCAGCHATEYADWQTSHHRAAMDHATDATVLGDFRDAEFEHFGRRTRFFRRDGGFWVNTENADGERQDFRVAYTFGITPLQQYLIEFPGGRLQALQICWDSRPTEQGGQRWYHLYPDEEIPPQDPLHWTRRHFNWNYMCADCHSTNLAKNYDPKTDTYRTTWSEMHVGCEACHGPGSKHLAWAASGTPSDDLGLLVRLKEAIPGAWGLDPETGHPKRSRPLDSQVQIETCAPCHSHRQLLQPQRWMGQPYLDTHVNSALDRVHYHADGQIKEEVYVYGSFVQSKMFQKDVRCIDCHQPHTLRLHAEGNALCVRCHQPTRYDTPAHHFHPVDSPGASCVECHMPPKHYMVVDKRRDHSLRVPRPDLSRKFGTPNACNTCHTDRDVAWAADAFTAWWGDKPRPSYGETLAKGRRDVAVWERELLQLARDQAAPGIARATALQLLDEAPSPRSLETARERLRDDPDPLARRQALTLLQNLPPAERWDAARIGLRDPRRAVRTESARILAGTPREGLSADDRAALDSGIAEYREMQLAVADVPESHLALAELHLALGEPARAEEAWAAALRIDPGFTAARVNWAEHLFAGNRLPEAEPILREGVERRPDDAYAHEAWGRYLVRRKRYDEGIVALRRAVELQPDRADLHYFIGVGFHTVGRFEDALPSLRKAVELAPGNEEYRSGAAAICRDSGREDLMMEFLPPRAP